MTNWSWRADGSTDGDRGSARATALGLGQPFPTQGEAESWLGECYPELSEAGITAVSLYEEERRVYGPMPLDS